MKTKYLALMIVISICITSCLSENGNALLLEQGKDDAYDALKVELARYTAEYYTEDDVVLSRVGFWKRLRGFLFADASGALLGSRFGGLGALFGAIYSSAIAGPVYSALDNEFQEILPMPIEPIEPIDSLVSPLYNVTTPEEPIEDEYGCIRPYVTVTPIGTGYLHNMILSKIDEKHPNILECIESADLIAEYVVDEMACGYGYDLPNSTKDLLIQKVDSMNMVDVDWGYDDIVTYVASLAPEYRNEFAIIEDFVANVEPLGGRVANIQGYLAGYLQIVNASNLTDEQKQILTTCIEVAANSAVLWVVK